MNIRLLKKEEHGETRKLWDMAFAEDGKEFSDYYYDYKTKENQIYVLEEDDGIRTMIQLNPYRLNFKNKMQDSFYIVGVATQPEYRKRGFMGKLLHRTLQQLYKKKMGIVFLMPAAEKIYLPYDFRYIYEQTYGKFSFEEYKAAEQLLCSHDVEWRAATDKDAVEIADFWNQKLQQTYDTFVLRDESYVNNLIQEQRCQNGEIVLLYQNRKGGGQALFGSFCYAVGNQLEIREPLCDAGKEQLLSAVLTLLFKERNKETILYGFQEGTVPSVMREVKKPKIMARLINIKSFLEGIGADEKMELVIKINDPILQENNGIFKWSLDKNHSEWKRSDDLPELYAEISDFTQFFFEQEGEAPFIKGDAEARKKLDKISRYQKSFFPEIV